METMGKAMSDDTHRLQQELKVLEEKLDDGEITESDYDAIRKHMRAYDPDDMTESPPENAEGNARTKKPSSIANEIADLRRVAVRMDTPLTEATTLDINQHTTDLRKGNVDGVKDGGLSKNSISSYQVALRCFYRVNDGLKVDADEIAMVDTRGSGKVNPDDMLTKEEIQWVRDAAGTPRNRALFDFLLYTGQRNTAARSLKVKHIDLQEETFALNGEAEGLKGADKIGKKRPLLGSVASLREWLSYHPAGEDPEAYVFCADPKYNAVDPHSMISRTAVGKVLRRMKERVQEDHEKFDKPLHPHALRHNFVTIAVREYQLDDGTIKWLIGHAPDSDVMRTTYAHLRDDDYIDRAQVAAGVKEPDVTDSHVPDFCYNCNEPLDDGDMACRRCGTVYRPDAAEATKHMDDAIHESKGQAAADGNKEAEAGVDAAKEILEDPEAKEAVMAELKDEIMAELKDEI